MKLIWKIRHPVLKIFRNFDKKVFLEKLGTLKHENETMLTEYLYHCLVARCRYLLMHFLVVSSYVY